ncbi:hypothetical protein D8B26_006041 [Coccidioides posadasii str. Silveira]|uniref:glucan endo-1,3-beta-D-glucosidase n=1 Tax=Coccidioides posadasii (strain RMSCC 757 / Silveira) TaxID=443226 RepID=E9DBW3_COCPS|nr:cell wall glucanase [Coccidioides posadasii str. Silveira]EFW16265.1 endo-beta-1,3-glucanase [Coccidioides posadasii str. Silveira]QVM11393.1 hypothetical protein D8B26_006041 [Coccidioides posadasii str. Silveira]
MPYHPQRSYNGGDPNENYNNHGSQQSSFPSNYQYELPSSAPFQPHGFHPAAHPDSAYSRLRDQRHQGHEHSPASQPFSQHAQRPHPTLQPVRSQTTRTDSTVSPGADNLGPLSAGGGITGIAAGIASTHERQSGLQAIRGNPDNTHHYGHHPHSDAQYYASNPDLVAMDASSMSRTPGSYSSNVPLSRATDGSGNNNNNIHSSQFNPHYDGLNNGPYSQQRTSWSPMNEPINPNDIVDDGDDGFIPNPKRKSVLSALGKSSSHQSLAGGAGAAGAGAAVGGAAGTIGGRVNRQTSSSPDGGPSYDALPGEKSEWLVEQRASKKKLKWIVGIIIAILVLGGIAGGVAGGLLPSRNRSNSSSSGGGGGQSADDDSRINGDLNKDSQEIKDLMNNPNLHRVFPGMDYTPWGTQYPLCLKYPPSQNNVTRDMAVLSQLTNTVRLYGTDCNQTEMVLHAIDKLELKDMKLWVGVWIDNENKTTNDRQLEQMYDILKSTADKSVFKGVIVGNEVLFRGHRSPATLQMLSDYLEDVKSKLKDMNIDLPVTTSDLGDAWTAGLARVVDVVMSNIHPFFGGVPVDEAADWTYEFWDNKDSTLSRGPNTKKLISEVGWPSGGGSNCGNSQCSSSNSGAVAGINELNQFMEDWVCPALEKGTDYFWFEAFDEPWKEQYNEPGKEWEDKWGLMDPGRNLKPGIKIPSCGGKTI